MQRAKHHTALLASLVSKMEHEAEEELQLSFEKLDLEGDPRTYLLYERLDRPVRSLSVGTCLMLASRYTTRPSSSPPSPLPLQKSIAKWTRGVAAFSKSVSL